MLTQHTHISRQKETNIIKQIALENGYPQEMIKLLD
jgi:hypothetical protein